MNIGYQEEALLPAPHLGGNRLAVMFGEAGSAKTTIVHHLGRAIARMNKDARDHREKELPATILDLAGNGDIGRLWKKLPVLPGVQLPLVTRVRSPDDTRQFSRRIALADVGHSPRSRQGYAEMAKLVIVALSDRCRPTPSFFAQAAEAQRDRKRLVVFSYTQEDPSQRLFTAHEALDEVLRVGFDQDCFFEVPYLHALPGILSNYRDVWDEYAATPDVVTVRTDLASVAGVYNVLAMRVIDELCKDLSGWKERRRRMLDRLYQRELDQVHVAKPANDEERERSSCGDAPRRQLVPAMAVIRIAPPVEAPASVEPPRVPDVEPEDATRKRQRGPSRVPRTYDTVTHNLGFDLATQRLLQSLCDTLETDSTGAICNAIRHCADFLVQYPVAAVRAPRPRRKRGTAAGVSSTTVEIGVNLDRDLSMIIRRLFPNVSDGARRLSPAVMWCLTECARYRQYQQRLREIRAAGNPGMTIEEVNELQQLRHRSQTVGNARGGS